jgi:hypothetical protein
MKRLLLLLLGVGVAVYLVKTQGLLTKTTAPTAGDRGSPIDRARSAAAASDARTAAGDAVAREADQPFTGSVSENMTPDQVRALLGPPDDVATETMASGGTRETWTYRSVGKSVVFENGIVAAVR